MCVQARTDLALDSCSQSSQQKAVFDPNLNAVLRQRRMPSSYPKSSSFGGKEQNEHVVGQGGMRALSPRP